MIACGGACSLLLGCMFEFGCVVVYVTLVLVICVVYMWCYFEIAMLDEWWFGIMHG